MGYVVGCARANPPTPGTPTKCPFVQRVADKVPPLLPLEKAAHDYAVQLFRSFKPANNN